MEEGKKGIFFLARGSIEELGEYYYRLNESTGEYVETEQDTFYDARTLYDMQQTAANQETEENNAVYREEANPYSMEEIKQAMGAEG